MNLRITAALGAALFSAGWLHAEDALVRSGFDHFYNLEYDRAIADFNRSIQQHPEAPGAYNHLAQAVLYREMFRSGALESELVTGNNPFLRRPKLYPSAAEQKQFDDAIAKVMEICQARIGRNADDTDALYALGVAYGLRANYSFLVRKAWMDALRDSTQARRLHDKVAKLDPDFIDARLMDGVHDYVVGSLPWYYKMVGFLAGFHGDRDEGIRTLQLVAEKGNSDGVDAEVLLAAIYRRERRARQAIPLLMDLAQRFPRNFLLHMELAQMYGDVGDKTRALAVLDRVEMLKRAGAAGYDKLREEKIDYARGNLLFWYNDLDPALTEMKKVTARAGDLDLNTGVYAWLRLGQIYDLKGQHKAATAAYKQAISYAPNSDAARESKEYLSSPYRRKG